MMPDSTSLVEKLDDVLPEKANSENALKEQLYIGGLFGIFRALTVIPGMPVEAVKIGLHTSPKGTTVTEIFNNILKTQGIWGFYKGTGWLVSRFFVKEGLKGLGMTNGAKYVNSQLDPEFLKKNSQAGYVIAAPFIAVPETFVGVLDRIRIASVTNDSKGGGASFIKDAYKNGGVGGVLKSSFRGGSINYVDKAFCTIMYHAMFQESARAINRYKNKNDDAELSAAENFGVSLFAGIFIAFVSNPLNVARTKFMQHNSPFKGVTDVFKHIYKEGAAFNGLRCNTIHGIIAALSYGASVYFTSGYTKSSDAINSNANSNISKNPTKTMHAAKLLESKADYRSMAK